MIAMAKTMKKDPPPILLGSSVLHASVRLHENFAWEFFFLRNPADTQTNRFSHIQTTRLKSTELNLQDVGVEQSPK